MNEELIQAAVNAAKNAYCPAKKADAASAKTGSAVLAKNGKIFFGCNVQSVISGLGICSERAAIYNAVANGCYNFNAIASFFPSKKFSHPCGACLQVLFEFSQVSGKDIEILEINSQGRVRETSVWKLMPDGYGPLDSGRDIIEYRNKK